MPQPEPSDAEINEGTSDAGSGDSKPQSEQQRIKSAVTGKKRKPLPSPGANQKFILGSMALIVTNNVVANLANSEAKTPAPKIVIGGFALTVGMLIMSEFQPELARALVIVMLIASFVGPNGTALLNLITKLTQGRPQVGTRNPNLS